MLLYPHLRRVMAQMLFPCRATGNADRHRYQRVTCNISGLFMAFIAGLLCSTKCEEVLADILCKARSDVVQVASAMSHDRTAQTSLDGKIRPAAWHQKGVCEIMYAQKAKGYCKL